MRSSGERGVLLLELRHVGTVGEPFLLHRSQHRLSLFEPVDAAEIRLRDFDLDALRQTGGRAECCLDLTFLRLHNHVSGSSYLAAAVSGSPEPTSPLDCKYAMLS